MNRRAAMTAETPFWSRSALCWASTSDRKAGINAVAASVSLVLLCLAGTALAEIPLSERKSGYEFMGRETRAMQDDDTTNPGMLWVLDGDALWKRKDGEANKSCTDCHGEAPVSMRGVAARYPAYDAARKRPVNLDTRINICRTDHQKAPPFTTEGKDLLALAAYVSRQSRGMPIEIKVDDHTRPFIEAGRKSYELRQGQLNLSCANCHDDNWGQKLAGAPIPQGHPTGYPQYRLEWQTLGSLQRRLRNCLVGMRTESFPLGAPDYVELEIFLMWRARGMPVEAPAVRP